MHRISGALLIFMMMVTVADICTRIIFESSSGNIDIGFIGAIELVRYSLLIIILFTLPYSINNSHVEVDLFTANLSERAKSNLSGFYNFGFSLLGGAMSFRFYEASKMAYLTGETSTDLAIPLYILYSISCFATSILAARALLGSCNFIFAYKPETRIVNSTSKASGEDL